MQFVEKRPKFYAAQFYNVNFIGEVEAFVNISGYKVEREAGKHSAQITVGEGLDKKVYTLNAGDWLLQDEAGRLSVITEREMRTRFESVDK